MNSTQEILQWAAGLGVGGVLAAFIFVWAWRSLQQNLDELKRIIDEQKDDKKILIDLIGYTNRVTVENTQALENVVRSTDNNTSVSQRLQQMLDSRLRGR